MSAAASALGVTTSGGGGTDLAVTIGAGTLAAGATSGHTFAANTAVPTGGTGPYTYQWTNTHDAFGNWSTGTGVSFAPVASGLANGSTSKATYVCKVTDSLGHVAYSNSAAYTYVCINFGGVIFGGIGFI